jgi:hypothetical protein
VIDVGKKVKANKKAKKELKPVIITNKKKKKL